MAYTAHGPPAVGDWVPQADFQAEQSKQGGWTATQSYQIRRESIDLETFQSEFIIGRPIEALYPDVEKYWTFLGLASIPRVQHQTGDYSLISVKFAGYTAPSGQGTDEEVADTPEPTPTYSLRGSITERDILLHPKAVALNNDADYGILLSLKNGTYELRDGTVQAKFIDEQSHVTWRPLEVQPGAGDASDLADLIGRGVHTYRFPTFLWTKTWESSEEINPLEIDNLGVIDVPDGDFPFPGGVGEDRDWMLVSATQDQEGLKFRNTLEWELSDRGGWDEFLYEV
jgi:hypothetical protein